MSPRTHGVSWRRSKAIMQVKWEEEEEEQGLGEEFGKRTSRCVPTHNDKHGMQE